MPKRLNDCWDRIACWQNLSRAHRKARMGKTSRPEVARFDFEWETEISRLEKELVELVWRPGPFRTFTIYEGKKRTISAVPYRDRVVHQAIMNVLAPHLERSFIFDTYACRLGKGTEAARLRAQSYMRRYRYFLHLDVMKYFPSVPHVLLKAQLRQHVGDRRLIEVLERIVDHDGAERPNDLVELAEARGLPIGSLTSQWFANLYLSPLDHWIKEELRVPGYVRYMDDMVLFADRKVSLWDWEKKVRRFAKERMGLALHGEPRLAPASEGLSFLGMRLFPGYRRLLPPSGYRFRRKMKGAMGALAAGRVARGRVQCQMAGWMGHARLANTVALRRAIFEELERGHRPGARTA